MLAEGASLPKAARFACAAHALTTTGVGAQPSLPTRDKVERFLASRKAI
jgi:ribokinase